MSTITYSTSVTEQDLAGIIHLQRANLPSSLTKEEIDTQGYVTVIHSFDDLKQLNDIEKHIIAKDDHNVVAYVLAMTEVSKFDIPILRPMFEMFGNVAFAGKTASEFNYLVVGQVCVDKSYRSMGIFDSCYAFYKDTYESKYDFAITGIAANNERSLRAHRRIGFNEVYRYTSEGIGWVIVVWDWNGIDAASLSS